MGAKISSAPSQKSSIPCCALCYHILLIKFYLQYFASFQRALSLPATTASLDIPEPWQLFCSFLPCWKFSWAYTSFCVILNLWANTTHLDMKVWCTCYTIYLLWFEPTITALKTYNQLFHFKQYRTLKEDWEPTAQTCWKCKLGIEMRVTYN